MMRQPEQILVFPYIKEEKEIKYCILKRRDLDMWQGIAGGVEEGEDSMTAAVRESFEELNIKSAAQFLRLDSTTSMPANIIKNHKEMWGEDVYVIKEFSFGVRIDKDDLDSLKISHEHEEMRWLSYDEAVKILMWDSNKTALWELNERLKKA